MAKRGMSKEETKGMLKSILGALISLGIIYWTFRFREFFGISLTVTFGLMFAFMVFTGILERKPFLPVYVIVASLAFRAGTAYFSLLENASSLIDLVVSVGIVALMFIVSFRAYSWKEKKKSKERQRNTSSSK
ncbi:MAG: hypothetical protein ABEI74_02265 [Candidatus Pacearchaeota archaeon]